MSRVEKIRVNSKFVKINAITEKDVFKLSGIKTIFAMQN